MKFRVHSLEHSEALQKKLFELGYKWVTGIQYLRTNSKFLYTDTNAQITHGDNSQKFEKRETFIETTLDDLYKIPKFSVVKLNNDYEAVINKETRIVAVGCQKFAFSRIEDLYKEMMK